MSGFDATAVTNLVKSLNSRVGEGLSTSGGSLHVDELAGESDGNVSGSLTSVKADGHAEQFTTTGKNLLRVHSLATITRDGVTFTPVYRDSYLQYIEFSGTSTARARYEYSTFTLPAGTYTFSTSNSTTNVGAFIEYRINDTRQYIDLGGQPGRSSLSFTLDTEKEITFSVDVRQSGINVNGVRIYPQIELGSTATEYEPYTGGAPSPSPDYPQEIQVVRGRNLIDPSALVTTYGCILTRDDVSGTYTITATASGNPQAGVFELDVRKLHGQSITLSYDGVHHSNSSATPRIFMIDDSGVGHFNQITATATSFMETIQVPANTETLRLFIRMWQGGTSSVGDTLTLSHLQLTLGSVPLPYVPYGYLGMEAQGRNLLVGSTREVISIVTNDIVYVDIQGHRASGTNTTAEYQNVTIGQQYTFKATMTGHTGAQLIANNNGTAVLIASITSGVPVTFTATYDTLMFRLGPSSVGATITIREAQLELGSIATEYQPYYHTTTPIPLPQRGWVAGLSDGTADSLRLDGAGKCEWTLPTKEIVLDGSETWYRWADNLYYTRLSDLTGLLRQSARSLADIFRFFGSVYSTDQLSDGEYGFNYSPGYTTVNGNMSVRANFASSVDDFKTWLTTHNITVLYPLATPIIEDCGYINMPSIPSDAVITIPELDNLNVKYMVLNTAAKDYAEDWEKRATRTDPVGGLKHTSEGLAIDTLVQNAEDNTVYGGLAEVTAKGHAEQFSTSGKNLLPNNVVANTVNGVTFSKSADGGVRVVGTCTGSMTVHIADDITYPAGTYTLSDGGVGSQSHGFLYETTKSYFVYSDYVTFTLTEESALSFGIRLLTNQTYNDTFYPQLELGSTATEYEPYTGGAPSPSPDYPQEIQVVRGRNLLPKLSTNVTNNGVTFTANKDGSITANGTATAISTCPIVASAIIENNETYTLSGCPKNVSGVSIRVSDSITNAYDDTGSGVTFSYANTSYFTCYILVTSGTTVSNLTFYPQLVKGSTPQPYVPYGHLGMEAQGRNLWDISNATDIAVYPDANHNLVSLSGQHTTYIRCEPNTIYTVSKTRVNQTDDRFVVFCTTDIPANGMSVDPVIQVIGAASQAVQRPVGTRMSVTIQTGSTSKYIGVWYANSTNYSNRYQENMQIYYHTTTPIPLPQRGWVAGLSDGTADSLRLDGAGKCEWELADAEVDLSQLAWIATSVSGMFSSLSLADVLKRIAINTTKPDWLCESLVVKDGDYVYSHAEPIIGQIASNNGLWARDGISTTVADFVSAINGSKFLFPLATPIVEDCGYVEDWPTDIPEGAVITIPELDAVGIKYFVDSTVTELAKQWYARANSEYEDRLTALEQAVAELATS